MTDNDKSKAAGARLSNEQYEALMEYLSTTGETRGDYIRRLIQADLEAHGIKWPEHEFIANKDRAEKGAPWLKKSNRK